MSTRSDSFIDPSSKDLEQAKLLAQERVAHTEEHENSNGKLKSNWPKAVDLYGSNLPCRLEGEVGDLVVLGKIPKEINGTFYRIMVDPFVPPVEGNVPLDGDGNISAFRFHDGRVDMKTRYVETERYKLERRAGKALFGLYRNPFTHHPCVRAAVDSTANTNLVYWASHLLAMKESALPYSVDPQTLNTLTYDPFGQISAKTFTAHPKVDPFTNDLIVHGYEAKGLATNDVVSYSISRTGVCSNELWFKQPWQHPGIIHDCAITTNWLILFIWPFEASINRMKKGGHHWAWNYDRGHTMIVAPRFPDSPPKGSGWKARETRHYDWKNCMAIHTAGAWEDPKDPNQLYIESSRVHDNAFPFFPSDDGRLPAVNARADFVRWHIDISKPSGTHIDDPDIILDVPAEFPRIDERFMTKEYNVLWLNVFINPDGNKNIYHGLNGLAMHNHTTGKTQYFYAGDDSLVQEPIFVPRGEDAVEGDGYVMALIERVKANRCDVVVIDTRDFEKAVAMVQLPFHMKAQVHGNWVSAKELGGYRSLVREVGEVVISGGGALEPL